jgi:hypothetical protein
MNWLQIHLASGLEQTCTANRVVCAVMSYNMVTRAEARETVAEAASRDAEIVTAFWRFRPCRPAESGNTDRPAADSDTQS